ncbi:MAG TPA: MFS transporter [Streptosporangiaceae bacterium]
MGVPPWADPESLVIVRTHLRARSQPSATARASVRDVLDAGQRRVLLAVCIIIGAATTVPASYNYVLVPMLHGLHASETQGSVLRQLPSVAGLMVIFLAGILGRRWGERRFIFRCGILFTAGNVVVAVAPGMAVAVAGLVLESIGGFGFVVVALALLSAQVTGDQARASAFATYAMVSPIVYLAFPLLAGVLVDQSSWRLVAVTWALSGVAILFAAHVLLPADDVPADSRELLTPALAGVVLAAAVQTVTFADRDGVLSLSVLVRALITVAAFLVLYWSYRRMESPSLSLAPLHQGGMFLLMIIIILISFANLWFYLTVGLQYIYGLNVLQTAMAMLPAQAAGIGGALIARKVMRRMGITVTGVVSLAALALSLLLSALIRANSPIWLPIAVMSLYAAASVAASVPLTNAVMNLAPEGEDGSASAFRSAARNIGAAVGVVVMSTIVFGAFSSSLTHTLRSQGLDTKQSATIAQRIRDGVTSEELAADYAVPLQQVNRIAAAQRDAMADGLRAHGLSGSAFTAGCLVIFYWSRRRQGKAAGAG